MAIDRFWQMDKGGETSACCLMGTCGIWKELVPRGQQALIQVSPANILDVRAWGGRLMALKVYLSTNAGVGLQRKEGSEKLSQR